MKQIVIPTIFSILLLGCEAGQPISSENQAEETKSEQPMIELSPEVEKLQTIALSGTHGYDITEALTTEIGPRLGGSPEEAKARDWTVEQFKALGLSNVHIEEFEVPGWVRVKKQQRFYRLSPNLLKSRRLAVPPRRRTKAY